MSRSQRFTFLGIAVVIAVVAVVVILAAGGGDDDDTGAQASATQTATPTPTQDQTEAQPQDPETPTPTPTPKPKPPLLKGGKVTRLEFKEGDTVKFRVVSPVAEEVHIHGYDIAKDLEPNKEITVSFPATIEGIFEIEYEHAGEQIGELRVEPN
jgi:outer membrane biosynthesis protein TonB